MVESEHAEGRAVSFEGLKVDLHALEFSVLEEGVV